MVKIFLSYARQDASVVHQLIKLLEQALSDCLPGFEIFSDQELIAGAPWQDVLSHQITTADIVLVLLSKNSKTSRFLENEAAIALSHKKIVIPVLLDDAARENWVWPLVARRQAVEFTGIDWNHPEPAISVLARFMCNLYQISQLEAENAKLLQQNEVAA